MTALNSVGQRLLAGLIHAKKLEDTHARELARAEKVHIVGAGGALTAAYEQLRNAAENTEEHLLVQNAIRRFYKQLFVTRDERLVRASGDELAIELTFAGYVQNNSLTKSQVAEISRLAIDHYATYEKLQKTRGINSDASSGWVLDTLAARVADCIGSHPTDTAFIDNAYQYFEQVIKSDYVTTGQVDADDFGASLFAAVHKALLKSDDTTIRAAILERYGIKVTDVQRYTAYNQQIDTLLKSPLTDKLYHVVDRQGAPMRIVRQMIEEREDMAEVLPKREVFLEEFEKQVGRAYKNIVTRVNRAIVRSVIFLIITKFLIGIAIEVPYDIWAHGAIVWGPLLINLFFPPIYMVLLRSTLTIPGYANTRALVDRADVMLYGERTVLSSKHLIGRRYGPVFSALYVLFSLFVFGVVIWLLLLLGFSLVHIAIFFVFFSAASFLGFRLSRLIRELEVVHSSSNGLTFIRDFIYLPFVVAGQWMSNKYSQVNIVTIVLDMMIELPLKTVLRLIRQWGAFIDDRKDQL